MKQKSRLILALTIMAIVFMLNPFSSKAANSGEKVMIENGIKEWDMRLMDTRANIRSGMPFIDVKGVTNFKIKSSNPNILKVTVEPDPDYETSLDFDAGKPGKVTVTATYKFNGKNYVSKARIKVVDYKNPVKTLKVGNTKYTSVFNKDKDGYKPVKGKKTVKLTMKKGYKITNCCFYTTGKSINYKSGIKVNFKKVTSMYIYYTDNEGYQNTLRWFNKKDPNAKNTK